MSERETWYVLDDGSVADPVECALDAKGILRHKGGVAVKVRGDTHWSRGVDVGAERAKAKQMKPAASSGGYLTRDAGADDSDTALTTLRAEYQTKFGKRAFRGWDAAALREKLATAAGE